MITPLEQIDTIDSPVRPNGVIFSVGDADVQSFERPAKRFSFLRFRFDFVSLYGGRIDSNTQRARHYIIPFDLISCSIFNALPSYSLVENVELQSPTLGWINNTQRFVSGRSGLDSVKRLLREFLDCKFRQPDN